VVSQIPGLDYQAGAEADSSSAGNFGVGVAILTHSYQMANPDESDAFFVGSVLSGGGFIQFGYEIQSGYMCLNGYETLYRSIECQTSEYIPNGDARWFWQYWPDSQGSLGLRFVTGPTMSAGRNDTWHTYAIVDYANLTWSFVLDGTPVSTLNVRPVNSSEAPYEAAEEGTSDLLGRLALWNLTYFISGSWHEAASLTTFSGCGIGCQFPSPFSATIVGNNDVIAGSLNPIPTSISYSGYATESILVPLGILLLTVTAVTIYFVRKKPSPEARSAT